jgi:hypothetical protein
MPPPSSAALREEVAETDGCGGGDPDTALRLIDPMTDDLPNDALWLARPGVAGPGTRDGWVAVQGGGPRSCSPPIVDSWGGRRDMPELCDVLGLGRTGGLLGHWNSDRRPGDWSNPEDGNGTVVALGFTSDDPRVVVAAGAPERVSFAVDLIEEALQADGGGS